MAQNGRRFVSLCRTLHIYLTMFSVVAMLFFSVTGFMLNHKDWFSAKENGSRSPRVEVERTAGRPDSLPRGQVEGRTERRPGTAIGVVPKLMNLHKGSGAGLAWKLVLDVTAGILFLGSLTGFILLLYLPQRRRLGLIAMAVGAALCLAAYGVAG